MYAGAAATTATFNRDLLVSGRIALNNAATLPVSERPAPPHW